MGADRQQGPRTKIKVRSGQDQRELLTSYISEAWIKLKWLRVSQAGRDLSQGIRGFGMSGRAGVAKPRKALLELRNPGAAELMDAVASNQLKSVKPAACRSLGLKFLQ